MESIESTTALKFDSNNYTVTSNKVFWSYYSSVSCNLHPAAWNVAPLRQGHPHYMNNTAVVLTKLNHSTIESSELLSLLSQAI